MTCRRIPMRLAFDLPPGRAMSLHHRLALAWVRWIPRLFPEAHP